MLREKAVALAWRARRTAVRAADRPADMLTAGLALWAHERHYGAGSYGQAREWFDHRIDEHLFRLTRSSHWAERGVYSRETIRPGDAVLDLCCGDGFYAHRFFSTVAGHIDGVDGDPDAIRHARRYHELPNISFHVGDITAGGYPSDRYDVAIWDGAIEHFSDAEVTTVLEHLDVVLNPDGLLHGMTILVDHQGENDFHTREFESEGQLEQLLKTVFPHAATFTREHPDRTCLYFRASRIPIENALARA